MKTANYIQAVRPVNLLMGMLILFAVRFGILRTDFPMTASESLPFFLYVFSVLLIMAWGYLINDYYDVETDKINRPGTNIFEGPVSPLILWILPLSGLAIPVLGSVLFQTPLFFPVLLNTTAIVLLGLYALRLKSTVFCGNLTISVLGTLLVAAPWLFLSDFENISVSTLERLMLYALFSFGVTMVRELVKDAEDAPGDTAAGLHTVATRMGISTSRRISVGLMAIAITGLLLIGLYSLFHSEVRYGAAFLFLALCGIFILFKLWPAASVVQFRAISLWLKLWMLCGMITMCL